VAAVEHAMLAATHEPTGATWHPAAELGRRAGVSDRATFYALAQLVAAGRWTHTKVPPFGRRPDGKPAGARGADVYTAAPGTMPAGQPPSRRNTSHAWRPDLAELGPDGTLQPMRHLRRLALHAVLAAGRLDLMGRQKLAASVWLSHDQFDRACTALVAAGHLTATPVYPGQPMPNGKPAQVRMVRRKASKNGHLVLATPAPSATPAPVQAEGVPPLHPARHPPAPSATPPCTQREVSLPRSLPRITSTRSQESALQVQAPIARTSAPAAEHELCVRDLKVGGSESETREASKRPSEQIEKARRDVAALFAQVLPAEDWTPRDHAAIDALVSRRGPDGARNEAAGRVARALGSAFYRNPDKAHAHGPASMIKSATLWTHAEADMREREAERRADEDAQASRALTELLHAERAAQRYPDLGRAEALRRLDADEARERHEREREQYARRQLARLHGDDAIALLGRPDFAAPSRAPRDTAPAVGELLTVPPKAAPSKASDHRADFARFRTAAEPLEARADRGDTAARAAIERAEAVLVAGDVEKAIEILRWAPAPAAATSSVDLGTEHQARDVESDPQSAEHEPPLTGDAPDAPDAPTGPESDGDEMDELDADAVLATLDALASQPAPRSYARPFIRGDGSVIRVPPCDEWCAAEDAPPFRPAPSPVDEARALTDLFTRAHARREVPSVTFTRAHRAAEQTIAAFEAGEVSQDALEWVLDALSDAAGDLPEDLASELVDLAA
jgi:hypothetical protein